MHNKSVIVIISANAEWQAVKDILASAEIHSTRLGEYFDLPSGSGTPDTLTRFFHGGWGKISAAATAQAAIDRWQPDLLVNLGTCGGFEGRISRGSPEQSFTTSSSRCPIRKRQFPNIRPNSN